MTPTSHSISRRALFQHAALSAIGLPLLGISAACTTHTAHSAPTEHELTIGYIPIACTAPLILAHAQGTFEELGLSVSLKKFAGWADLWSAYATGELDVAHMLSPMPIAMNAGVTQSHRATELVFTQNTNGQAITIASKHADTISSATDFRGKTIGIPFEFSVHALLFRDYLSAGGVDPEKDVELRLLRPADMIAQLHVGGIDAFVGPEPFNQRAVVSGAGKVFTLTKELWPNHPCCSIAMAKDRSAAHPHLQQVLTTALAQASEFANNQSNHQTVANILSEEQYLHQPAELLLPALDPQRISFGGHIDSTAITWMATQIARWNLGGTALTMDDPTLIRATDAVLPDDVSVNGVPTTVNGRAFDPNIPTFNY